jgi:hypothetical protein
MITSYDKYIQAAATEPTEFKKIVMFSTMPMDEKQSVQPEIGKVFEFCDDPDTYLSDHLLQSLPILLWDRQSLIEKYGIEEANNEIAQCSVYNEPHGIIVSKLDMLKLLNKAKCNFIPMTVFDRKEAGKKLKFPLIAKASNTFQSRGVEKVNTATELKKLPPGFDVYQEQIQIDEEFRMVFFKGKRPGITMLSAYRRDPLNNKAKDLRTNEAGMFHDRLMKRPKSSFSWTQVYPYDYTKIDLEQCYLIAAAVFALNPTLNVAGLDIAIDKDGKHWFIESNSTPGLFSNMVPLIYKFIYEDHYGPIQNYGQRRLRDMCYYFTELTVQDEPTFKLTDTKILNHLDGYLPQFR